MAFLTTNYSNLSDNTYSVLPKGDYEMIIRSAEMKATRNGKENLSIALVVRNDLANEPKLAETNGKYSNRYVFDQHWKRNTPEGYVLNTDNLLYILQAVGVPEGTPIDTIEDLINSIEMRPVKVYVDVEFDDYNQKDRNTVAPWNYDKTSYPQVKHEWKNKNANNAKNTPYDDFEGNVDISEDDLPF